MWSFLEDGWEFLELNTNKQIRWPLVVSDQTSNTSSSTTTMWHNF